MPTSSLSAREMRTRWALVAALLLLLHLPSPVRTQCAADFFGSGCQQVYSVTTVVGFLGLTGFADGAPSVTRVNTVSGLALDASGNAWFSDVSNGAIRVLNSSTGNVSTLLRGGSYVSAPTSLALDAAGNMYYADMGTSGTTPYIRRINIATGAASAIAGTGGTGTANGFATASSFRSPRGIAFDGSGTLVVIADTGRSCWMGRRHWNSGAVYRPFRSVVLQYDWQFPSARGILHPRRHAGGGCHDPGGDCRFSAV